jgi:hypothetical protein
MQAVLDEHDTALSELFMMFEPSPGVCSSDHVAPFQRSASVVVLDPVPAVPTAKQTDELGHDTPPNAPNGRLTAGSGCADQPAAFAAVKPIVPETQQQPTTTNANRPNNVLARPATDRRDASVMVVPRSRPPRPGARRA